MKKTLSFALFTLLLCSCTYLFIGPKVKRSQFKIIAMDNFTDTIKKDIGVYFDNFYVHLYKNDSLLKQNGEISRYYYLIKFYPNGKLGYSGGYSSESLDSITLYNLRLKPYGYEWGYYFTEGDSICIEVKARHNDAYHFWGGIIKGDNIYITDDLDFKYNKIKRKDPIIFEYKY